MLLVKTSLRQSSIHGLGLFADEFIPKGTRTWEYNPMFDMLFTPHHLYTFSVEGQRQMKMYTYWSNQLNGYVLCSDTGKHMNHADNPNTDHIEVNVFQWEIANCDIQIGEEITCDYKTFDANWKQKLQP